MQGGLAPSTEGAGAEASLSRAVMMWSALAPKDFPNGAVLFCSDEVYTALHPARPLAGEKLFCEQSFDTSVVREELKVRYEQTCGVVIIDGLEATLGIVQASGADSNITEEVFKIAHISSHIASRTRRGGQSATRYSRNRDLEELAFLRKVAEVMSEAFSDICGIVVGGCADMKRKLIVELPNLIKDRVTSVVDLPDHANLDGLRKMIGHASDVIKRNQQQVVERAVNRFMELVAREGGCEETRACYGEKQTLVALQMGIVGELLITKSLRHGVQRWREVTATCGCSVVEVLPNSIAGARFCEGFVIGAYLRYPVDTTLLEEDSVSEKLSMHTEQDKSSLLETHLSASSQQKLGDIDIESNSTAPSEVDSLLHNWLIDALTQAVHDAAVVESLAIGVELVLFDDTLELEERMENTLELLREEGISEDILAELVCHVTDHFGKLQ